MSGRLYIKRLDGGLLIPSATWRQVSRRENGTTAVMVLEGSGPAFQIDDELKKLRGVVTNWGVYKEHSVVQGAPGIYDKIGITFQGLVDPPIYLYTFKSTTVSIPMRSHPGYRTYWDHDLVSIVEDEDATKLTTAEMNDFHAVTDGTIPAGLKAIYAWRKAGQAIAKGEKVVEWDGSGSRPTSSHTTGTARMTGMTTVKVPSITVTETIYFIEKSDFTFSFAGLNLTIPNLNTKTVASMAGKAGWPLDTQFGYPRDVYALLNDPTLYGVDGKAISSDFSDYRHVGKLLTDNGFGVETISDVSMEATFFKNRGIPTGQYITPLAIGKYSKNSYGHPLWLCNSCNIKKVGYWYEATLTWDYYNFGIDAAAYPVATARVNGLA